MIDQQNIAEINTDRDDSALRYAAQISTVQTLAFGNLSAIARVFRPSAGFRFLVCLGLAATFASAGSKLAMAQEADVIKQAPKVKTELGADSEAYVLPARSILGTDIDGNAFDLRRLSAGKPVVVALTSTSCPLCKKYGPTLAQLEDQFSDQVNFVFLGAIASDSLEDAKAARERLGWDGPYVLDTSGQLLEKLNAKSTTEVLLLDDDLNVVYRGAVDDQYGLGYTKIKPQHFYLRDAIESLLAGNDVSVAATSAPGCVIAPLKKKSAADLEYYADIFPIVQNRCVTCHREKGVGPFALEDPQQLIAHAGMVQEVVSNKTMPPWFAEEDSDHPNQWMNNASIPDEERQKLLDWLAGDQTVAAEPEVLVRRQYKSGWTIGEPDLIVKLPRKVPVHANGYMDYIHMKIELDIPEDQWITAVEVRPTAPEVVHHVLVYQMEKDSKRVNIDESSHFLAAYAPGNSSLVYPKGLAKRLPGNSDLVVQMHYTPNGEATTDQTEIAFRLSKEKPEHEVFVRGIADTRLNIPPGAENHKEEKLHQVGADVVALAFFPHMHLRGKAFRYQIKEPKQAERNLLNVPAYDFNWQLEYRLQKPLPISRGSQLRVTGWFDNSDQNPANPDSSVSVKWGDQTFDEMLIGYVEYYLDDSSE